MPGGHEILEHTADVGIHAWGDTTAEAFENAAAALAEILGARPLPGAPRAVRPVRAAGSDLGALLVEFLNELLLLHETEEAALGPVRVTAIRDGGAGVELEAEAEAGPVAGEPEGTALKAATYHLLEVREGPEGVDARVYLDV
ncbi:MAG: archease [Actinobacteria bacterium]|nr:archease [Actinomycetota bacterium]